MDTWLLPRKMTLPLLVALFIVIGQLAWVYAPSLKFLSFGFGLVTPFCMTCAAFVWGMREKSESYLIVEQLSAAQYHQARKVQDGIHFRSMKLAAVTAAAGLVAAVPAFSKEQLGAVWQWMVIAASLSAAVAVYAYLLAYAWDRQLRAHRDHERVDYKTTVERRALIDRIEQSQRRPIAAEGWTEGPSVEPPATPH